MKRKIGLLLCIVTLLASSGCMVKKEAGTTGETSKEITVEITPEVTKEQTKEQLDVNNNSEDNKNTDNTNQNSTHPNKNDNKPEPTPEFYDFMTLDPDVDIENEQVREDIYKRISDYCFENAKCNFTKKENYLYELYDEESFTKNSRIDYYIKSGTTDFYSPNTKKKLADLGFEFEIHDNNNPFITYSQKGFPDNSKEEYIYKLKQAFKIILEDHNVTCGEISIYASSAA